MALPSARLQTPMDVLGKRLQAARVLKNVTQAALAKQVGIGERVLKRLEAGGNVSLESWLKVAEHLGYLKDLMGVFRQEKPTTIEQHQAIAQGRHKPKLRARA